MHIFRSNVKNVHAIFHIIEDFRDFWNKAAPHTPPPPTKHMFYKVLQWWKSGFNIVHCNMF